MQIIGYLYCVAKSLSIFMSVESKLVMCRAARAMAILALKRIESLTQSD